MKITDDASNFIKDKRARSVSVGSTVHTIVRTMVILFIEFILVLFISGLSIFLAYGAPNTSSIFHIARIILYMILFTPVVLWFQGSILKKHASTSMAIAACVSVGIAIFLFVSGF